MKKAIYAVLVPVIYVVCFGCATTPEVFFQLVESGDYAELKRIIEAGADVNALSKEGFTALMKTSRKGRTDLVELLL